MAADMKEARKRRHSRIRKTVEGTKERPRLSVYRSLNHIYAQIVDDTSGSTIAGASSLSRGFDAAGHRGNIATAKQVGAMIAKNALKSGIKKVVFDRSGYLYHGRVRALADAAREAGLEF